MRNVMLVIHVPDENLVRGIVNPGSLGRAHRVSCAYGSGIPYSIH